MTMKAKQEELDQLHQVQDNAISVVLLKAAMDSHKRRQQPLPEPCTCSRSTSICRVAAGAEAERASLCPFAIEHGFSAACPANRAVPPSLTILLQLTLV